MHWWRPDCLSLISHGWTRLFLATVNTKSRRLGRKKIDLDLKTFWGKSWLSLFVCETKLEFTTIEFWWEKGTNSLRRGWGTEDTAQQAKGLPGEVEGWSSYSQELFESQTWKHVPVISALGDRHADPRNSLASSPSQVLSSRLSERPCLKELWWRVKTTSLKHRHARMHTP